MKMDKVDKIFYNRRRIMDDYSNQNISRIEKHECLLKEGLSAQNLSKKDRINISKALNNLKEEKQIYISMKKHL